MSKLTLNHIRQSNRPNISIENKTNKNWLRFNIAGNYEILESGLSPIKKWLKGVQLIHPPFIFSFKIKIKVAKIKQWSGFNCKKMLGKQSSLSILLHSLGLEMKWFQGWSKLKRKEVRKGQIFVVHSPLSSSIATPLALSAHAQTSFGSCFG
jgi:hypothetical protein